MILVTIGTQLPFDRLIKIMDTIAPSLSDRVFAQIGNGEYRPTNIEWQPSIDANEFEGIFEKAKIIVSHAGMGTVLTAQKMKKPIIIFPRSAALGEHRNDHQLATAKQLQERPGVYVAYGETDLKDLLQTDLAGPLATEVEPEGRRKLVGYLKDFIQSA